MLRFLKALLARYGEDEVANRAAALSYYTIFSLGPLLFIVLGILGLVANNASYRAQLLNQLSNLVGANAANLLSGALSSQGLGSKTGLAFWVGGIGLVLGAIGIFGQLSQGLNAVLHVQVGPGAGRKPLVRQKLIALGLVGVICFLLVVSLAASAFISGAAGKLHHGIATGFAFFIIDFVSSLVILGLLLALLYRCLPAVKIKWTVLIRTSLVVALLFTIGKVILGIIIGRNTNISAFGAAGSLIALLLWIFYSGQILYLGAAGLAVYLDNHPDKLKPRFEGKEAVLKIEKNKKELPLNLPQKVWDHIAEGWHQGWRDDDN